MLCFFIGLKFIPASKATLISNIHPILVTIMAYFMLQEDLTASKILAVIGAFVGVIIFTSHEDESEQVSGSYTLGIMMVTVT